MDGGFGFGPFIWLGFLAPANEPGFVQVGMVWSTETGAGWVIGARPVFTPVVKIAQSVEIFLPSRRESIEGFTS